MAQMLMGTKLGMTRVFNDQGISLPCTVIAMAPNVVTQIRTPEKDGYAAIQVAFDDIKPRNSTQSLIAHDHKAGTTPKRHHREFRVSEAELKNYTLGQTLTVAAFEAIAYVDVVGTSKGKGFQGTMKRHHFKGMFASHGTERKHRSPGSIGSLCSNRGFGGGLKKGKRMSGHMGDVRRTCRSLDVVRIDAENNLLLVKGTVPGSVRKMVMVSNAARLYKSKARKQEALTKGK
jgi:large subunit ribosomal protein L3